MSYALDVTGTSSANRISDEYAYVTPGRELKEPSLIIPRAAPFFGANLEIYTAKEKRGTKLINGEDYILLNPFAPLIQQSNAAFFYGIWIKNPEVTKDLWLNYNTAGGSFAVNEEDILEKLLGLMAERIYFDWSQITNKPSAYPPRFHTHQESEQPMPAVVAKFKNLVTVVSNLRGVPVDTTVPEV